jgi:hypothetical protein
MVVMKRGKRVLARHGPFLLGYDTEAVSPDGRWFVYADPKLVLTAIRLGSGHAVKLGSGTAPTFSHDSRYLAFYGTDEAARASIFDLHTHRFLKIGGSHRYLAGLISWAHRSDRLLGFLENGGPAVAAIVSAGRPHRIPPVANGQSMNASSPNWSWADNGLVYWLFGEHSDRLMMRRFGSARPQTLATLTGSRCGKTCDTNAPPFVAATTVLFTQTWHACCHFAFLGGGRLRPVPLPHQPYAIVFDFSVSPDGRQVLMGWAGRIHWVWCGLRCVVDIRKLGVALWRVGQTSARSLGPGLGASWVSR